MEEGPARTSRTLEQLRSVDPYFSEEAFIGNLSNKLMSIYYADCMKDIRAFVECDMTPLLQARRGVFDCRLLECVLMEYHTHDQYQCLDVKVKAGLTVLQNGSVFRSEEHLRLYMVRNVNAVTQSMNDVNVYKCDSCGAGLSLLNGGKCDYCGNGLDLKKYDWVITDFMMVQA